VGELAQALVENPLFNSALSRALGAGERAASAQRSAMGALNLALDQLPERLEQRLRSFDPKGVDVKPLANQLLESPVAGRHTLMELTAQYCSADGQMDLDEDRFVLALALALGLEPQEYGHIVYDSPFRGWRRALKRLEDLLLGTFFTLLFAPVMIAIAIAIKLTSRGPVFFRQRRHGLRGEAFEILKFRTMHQHREEEGRVTQAKRDDERVFAFGRFLRRSSLDELPQLFNVLSGQMSLVGPRPHAEAHNRYYQTVIERYMWRHAVKPGITGWAQVSCGYGGSVEDSVEKLQYDLYYVKNHCLFLD